MLFHRLFVVDSVVGCISDRLYSVFSSIHFLSGNTAESVLTRHYRLKNDFLCIQVSATAPCSYSLWTFNSTVIVNDKEVTPNFTAKVDYNPGNLSLCISKLTEADSGIYEAVVVCKSKKVTDQHILLVQGTSFH